MVLTLLGQLTPAQREAVTDRIQSLPFNYRFLVGQTGIDSAQVREALEYLHDQEYLHVDFGYAQHDGTPNEYGVHVWLRARLEAA